MPAYKTQKDANNVFQALILCFSHALLRERNESRRGVVLHISTYADPKMAVIGYSKCADSTSTRGLWKIRSNKSSTLELSQDK